MASFQKGFTQNVRNGRALRCGAQRRARTPDPTVFLSGKRTASISAKPPRMSSGFTLVELIVTLVIIGVLAIAVIPKMSGINVIQQRGDYDKVVSTLEYARKSAIAQRRSVCVDVAAAALTLTIDANPPETSTGTCANTLALPSPDPQCGAVTNRTCPKTQTITASVSPFKFDPLGRASTTVTLTVSGFPALTIEAETGYVH